MSSTLLQEVMIKGNVSAYKKREEQRHKKAIALWRVHQLFKWGLRTT